MKDYSVYLALGAMFLITLALLFILAMLMFGIGIPII